ncbi:MAG: MFS transporter [Chthonomonadales bacterium]
MAGDQQPIVLTIEQSAIRRVTRRLIPFMCLMYTLNIIDRVNVTNASLAIMKNLGYTAQQYGFGAGIFFVGYFIFEVPSNLILEKVGARRWMARIMVTWGIIASCMMFITPNPMTYYALRFLLGVAEAGFFPGMILYLTYWFPSRERGRAGAKFIIATLFANIIGGPLGASLLKLDGSLGLQGWQWLFLLEGIPSFLVGFVALKFLTDRPSDATWLPDDEKAWLIGQIAKEQSARKEHASIWAAFREKKVLHLCLLFFLWQVTNNGLGFFIPKLLKARSDWTDTKILWMTAIPAIIGAISLMIAAHYSDKMRERKKFIVHGFIAYIVSMVAVIFVRGGNSTIVAVSAKEASTNWANAPFWTVATGFLSGTAAAGSIALINATGNLGGFVGPSIMGALYDKTHSYHMGLVVMMFVMFGTLYSAIRLQHSNAEEHGEE